MLEEISAKTLLSSVRQPDPWFGLRYSMNLYRGCQHGCIYCDSRSACYGIENFTTIQVKRNGLELLRKELSKKRIKGTIGTGSMHDPYMPVEAELNMTGRALEIIAEFDFPVHVITKGDLVTRDVALLQTIGRVYSAVSFTITAAADDLSRKVEPGAPVTSRRLQAMATLAEHGILTGVTMMPILPFLEDTGANILAIIQAAKAHGATYILPAFGLTMRDRQRDYYYARLDHHFPGLRRQYERRYGSQYWCPSPHASRLEEIFRETCDKVGLATQMPCYTGPSTDDSPLAPRLL